MVKSESKRCSDPDCNRWATKASNYSWCYYHDPKITPEQKKDARERGGKTTGIKTRKRHGIASLRDAPLESIHDIEHWMKVVIYNTIVGDVPEDFGNNANKMLLDLFKVMKETGDWTEKMKEVKEMLKDAKRR